MLPGVPLEPFIEAVALQKEISCSNIPVEQGHAAHASVHVYHPNAGYQQICTRGLVSSARVLFRCSAAQKEINKLEHQRALLQKRNPNMLRVENVSKIQFGFPETDLCVWVLTVLYKGPCMVPRQVDDCE